MLTYVKPSAGIWLQVQITGILPICSLSPGPALEWGSRKDNSRLHEVGGEKVHSILDRVRFLEQ